MLLLILACYNEKPYCGRSISLLRHGALLTHLQIDADRPQQPQRHSSLALKPVTKHPCRNCNIGPGPGRVLTCYCCTAAQVQTCEQLSQHPAISVSNLDIGCTQLLIVHLHHTMPTTWLQALHWTMNCAAVMAPRSFSAAPCEMWASSIIAATTMHSAIAACNSLLTHRCRRAKQVTPPCTPNIQMAGKRMLIGVMHASMSMLQSLEHACPTPWRQSVSQLCSIRRRRKDIAYRDSTNATKCVLTSRK